MPATPELARRTFVVLAPIPQLHALEGDVIEYDPSDAEYPVLTVHAFGPDAAALLGRHSAALQVVRADAGEVAR